MSGRGCSPAIFAAHRSAPESLPFPPSPPFLSRALRHSFSRLLPCFLLHSTPSLALSRQPIVCCCVILSLLHVCLNLLWSSCFFPAHDTRVSSIAALLSCLEMHSHSAFTFASVFHFASLATRKLTQTKTDKRTTQRHLIDSGCFSLAFYTLDRRSSTLFCTLLCT